LQLARKKGIVSDLEEGDALELRGQVAGKRLKNRIRKKSKKKDVKNAQNEATNLLKTKVRSQKNEAKTNPIEPILSHTKPICHPILPIRANERSRVSGMPSASSLARR
jgi:hypothetical protein